MQTIAHFIVNMKITDIAHMAKVSTSMVSRVINESGYVKKEKREEILKLIKKYGYVPNVLARNLNKKDCNIIAVITASKLNPFFGNILDAIQDKASNDDCGILFFNTVEDIKKEEKALSESLKLRVKGIILLPILNFKNEYNNVLDNIKKNNVPIVLLDRNIQKFKSDIVYVDNEKVIYEATSMLIKNGYKKIAIITCPEVVEKGKTRLDGYLKALTDFNFKIKKEYIYKGEYSVLSGYNACKTLFNLKKPPDAVVATCSSLIIGCENYFKEHNIVFGKDVGIVGFDDISLVNIMESKVSSYNRPTYEMGNIAYDLLSSKINNKHKKIKEVLVDTTFISKGSEKKNNFY